MLCTSAPNRREDVGEIGCRSRRVSIEVLEVHDPERSQVPDCTNCDSSMPAAVIRWDRRLVVRNVTTMQNDRRMCFVYFGICNEG